jgi:hypothetical protein
VQLPTATTDELGTGRWSAGPTGALIYSSGPWLNGVLTYHLASFAGDRHRSRVNQTYIEPEVSYSFASGWYVQCDPALTYDWTADSADAWSIPMGCGHRRCAHDRRTGDELPARRVRFPEAPGRGGRMADARPGDAALSRQTLAPRPVTGRGDAGRRGRPRGERGELSSVSPSRLGGTHHAERPEGSRRLPPRPAPGSPGSWGSWRWTFVQWRRPRRRC